MSKIEIVGLGPGNLDFITGAGINSIRGSEIVIGGKRQLQDVESILEKQEKYVLGNLDGLLEYLNRNEGRRISIIVSGDTGFYSLLEFMKKNFSKDKLKVIPGISSFQYLFSKIGKSWHEFSLCSIHGRTADYMDTYHKSNRGIVLLTDKNNTPYEIGRQLTGSGFGEVMITVGENLSYPSERITSFRAEEYVYHDREYEMNVIILEKGE